MTVINEYTMDTFHAEMERRGVRAGKKNKRAAPRKFKQAAPPPRHGSRAFYNQAKCRCALCRAANSSYYHALKAAKQRPEKRPWMRAAAQPPTPSSSHGLVIETVVACGVHPLHYVKVRANGSRSGCPMCEMQIEAICHAFTVRR